MRMVKGLAAAAACVLLMAQAPGDQEVILHPLMKGRTAVQAQQLWDVGNNAMDDNGNPDPKKISAADWSRLTAAAGEMQADMARLAAAAKVRVAAPGDKLQDEGSPESATPAQIQGFIDADHTTFTRRATELASVADEFVAAAKAKDAGKLMSASEKLDVACESCHATFWYPQQVAPK